MADILKTAPDVADADGACLVQRLVHLSKIARALDGFRLSSIGLVLGQDECVLALDADAGRSISNLAGQLGVSTSSVSKMVDRLEISGLVARSGDEKDSRVSLVRVTEKGNKVRAKISALRDQAEEEFRLAYGPERAREIAQALQTINTAIRGRMAGVRSLRSGEMTDP
jgi:DNA-binding MarR family transcriptional regulator